MPAKTGTATSRDLSEIAFLTRALKAPTLREAVPRLADRAREQSFAIGHVYWTQGRCMMLIGLEVEGPRVERLSAGAKAIYERTGGTCPD